jgi:hypothetical protein
MVALKRSMKTLFNDFNPSKRIKAYVSELNMLKLITLTEYLIKLLIRTLLF